MMMLPSWETSSMAEAFFALPTRTLSVSPMWYWSFSVEAKIVRLSSGIVASKPR